MHVIFSQQAGKGQATVKAGVERPEKGLRPIMLLHARFAAVLIPLKSTCGGSSVRRVAAACSALMKDVAIRIVTIWVERLEALNSNDAVLPNADDESSTGVSTAAEI